MRYCFPYRYLHNSQVSLNFKTRLNHVGRFFVFVVFAFRIFSWIFNRCIFLRSFGMYVDYLGSTTNREYNSEILSRKWWRSDDNVRTYLNEKEPPIENKRTENFQIRFLTFWIDYFARVKSSRSRQCREFDEIVEFKFIRDLKMFSWLSRLVLGSPRE